LGVKEKRVKKKRAAAPSEAPSDTLVTDFDDRHVLLSRLRQAEELIRAGPCEGTGCLRDAKEREALYELKSANRLVDQVVKDLIAHGIEEGDLMFGERSTLS
jgi:hypothetical protein